MNTQKFTLTTVAMILLGSSLSDRRRKRRNAAHQPTVARYDQSDGDVC